MYLCYQGLHVQIQNKNAQKNQIVTAGRLVPVLDIRPNHRRSHLTTDSHTTTERAALLTAPATATLILGLVPLPTYHMKDRNQAQTRSGMWHFYIEPERKRHLRLRVQSIVSS